eukprot:347332-Chlamydomonas_euryale.AAC.1
MPPPHAAGEGDGLPGLVVDVYGAAAVIKFDGPVATAFYDATGIAEWLVETALPAESHGMHAC